MRYTACGHAATMKIPLGAAESRRGGTRSVVARAGEPQALESAAVAAFCQWSGCVCRRLGSAWGD